MRKLILLLAVGLAGPGCSHGGGATPETPAPAARGTAAAPPNPVTAPPPIDMRAWEDHLQQKADRLLDRGVPALDGWEQSLYKPGWSGQLDLAYNTGLQRDPAAAFRALMEGCFEEAAGATFARRLQLICWTLRPETPPPAADVSGRHIAARLASLPPPARQLFQTQYAGYGRRLRGEVLAATRSGRVPDAVAVTFAVLEPSRADHAILALVATRSPANGPAAQGLTGDFDAQGFSPLIDGGLSVPELESLVTVLLDNHLLKREQVRRERHRLLDGLAAEARRRDLDEAGLLLLAGLHGGDDALPRDLARLVHRESRDGIVRRLKSSAGGSTLRRPPAP